MTSQQIVREVLKPYHPRIRRIVEQAWAEWRQVEKFRVRKGYGAVLYPRTSANFVFDAIARTALKEFVGDTSVRVVAEAQTVKFVFKGAVIGRFKKGGEDGMGSNQ